MNNNGTIGPDFQAVKPLNVYRIICLGDSTSEWPKHHPQFLQEKLIGKSHEQKIIEVLNAGIGGHVSAFTLQYFALRLVHFKPDLVILKVGYNDYLPFGHPELGYDYSVAFSQAFHAPRCGPSILVPGEVQLFPKAGGQQAFGSSRAQAAGQHVAQGRRRFYGQR